MAQQTQVRITSTMLNCAVANRTTALAVVSPTSPASKRGAGIIAYIAPDGCTVVRFRNWMKIVKRAKSLPSHERVAFLKRKAQGLEKAFGWLKELWRRRLQKVLLRQRLLGLLYRWDGRDACLKFHSAVGKDIAEFSPPQHYTRAPPFESDANLIKLSSPAWTAPAILSPSAPPALPA